MFLSYGAGDAEHGLESEGWVGFVREVEDRLGVEVVTGGACIC